MRGVYGFRDAVAPFGRIALSPVLKSKSSGGKDYFGFNAVIPGSLGPEGYAGGVMYMCSKGLPTANSIRRWRLATDLSFTYETVSKTASCYIRCLGD